MFYTYKNAIYGHLFVLLLLLIKMDLVTEEVFEATPTAHPDVTQSWCEKEEVLQTTFHFTNYEHQKFMLKAGFSKQNNLINFQVLYGFF